MLFTKDQEIPTHSISNFDENLENENDSLNCDNFDQNVISSHEGGTGSGAGVGENEQQNTVVSEF